MQTNHPQLNFHYNFTEPVRLGDSSQIMLRSGQIVCWRAC
jgi:hypothetical protein